MRFMIQRHPNFLAYYVKNSDGIIERKYQQHDGTVFIEMDTIKEAEIRSYIKERRKLETFNSISFIQEKHEIDYLTFLLVAEAGELDLKRLYSDLNKLNHSQSISNVYAMRGSWVNLKPSYLKKSAQKNR